MIELMIVLIIMAVFLTLVAPGMSNFFDTQNLKAASEEVYSDIQMARSESIARKVPIQLKFDANATTTWTYAVSDVDDCDLTVTSVADATACTLVIDDGDLQVHGVGGVTDNDDKILQVRSSTNHSNITLARDSFQNGTEITFEPINGSAIGNSGNLLLTSPMGKRVLIKVSPMGQVRLCSPDNSVVGYIDGDSSDANDC